MISLHDCVMILYTPTSKVTIQRVSSDGGKVCKRREGSGCVSNVSGACKVEVLPHCNTMAGQSVRGSNVSVQLKHVESNSML